MLCPSVTIVSVLVYVQCYRIAHSLCSYMHDIKYYNASYCFTVI